jgi:hypothetical protein
LLWALGGLAFVLLFALAAATVGFATFAMSVVCSRPPALCRFSVFIAVVISVFSFSFSFSFIGCVVCTYPV